MNQETKPNLVIIRMPDEDGKKNFLEISFEDEHGKLCLNPAVKFGVNEQDSFNELGFDELVMAARDGEHAFELVRVNIIPLEGSPTHLYSDAKYLQIAVYAVMKDYFGDNGIEKVIH